MNNVDLTNLVFGDAQRIVTAISTGAGWEIWMQVELAILLRNSGRQVAREVPYPPPNAAWTLDVLCADALGHYAIEIKVESATNAGAQIINGINADRVKIANYTPQVPGARWVLGIGYSNVAVQAMAAFANTPANNAIFNFGNNLGVLVATV